jgi:hypothetical protein
MAVFGEQRSTLFASFPGWYGAVVGKLKFPNNPIPLGQAVPEFHKGIYTFHLGESTFLQ